ncbi:hypothetical protein [Kamptonema formosum]|uniref:hypothetical protein n=1 Tax=Kamptonema formosum TaxID=331992 RepID=UPI00034B18CA|nr:hypothetical protein [Oscillatoria sp. PCC 10802]
MQRILSSLGQTLRKSFLILSLALSLGSLISLSGLFLFSAQPGYAATAADRQPDRTEIVAPTYPDRQPENRQEAYEEAVEDAESLQSMQQAYRENLEEYREANPEPSLLEKVGQAIENLTAND